MSLIVMIPPKPPVTLNSTGAGGRNTSAFSPMSTSFSHTVASGDNRRMYAFVAVGHLSWLNSYTSLTATSSVDGAFTNISGPIFFGDSSGFRQGSVTVFELVNPSVGAHTITFQVSASQWLDVIGGNTRCYNNVGGRDTPVTQAQTTTNGALNLSVASGYGDMIFMGSAFSATPTFAGGMPTPWYAAGSSINGDADYLRAFDVSGTGSTFNFATSSTAHKVGAIGVNLKRI